VKEQGGGNLYCVEIERMGKVIRSITSGKGPGAVFLAGTELTEKEGERFIHRIT